MAYGDFKDSNRRTAIDKVSRNKAISVAKIPKYDGYQRGLTSMVYLFLDKKSSGRIIKIENISNKELTDELHKSMIRTIIKVHSLFIDNI